MSSPMVMTAPPTVSNPIASTIPNTIPAALSVPGIPIGSASSLWDSPLYYDCWWRHLAKRFKIRQQKEAWLVQQDKVFKGLIPVNVLRQAGWNGVPYQWLDDTRYDGFLAIHRQFSWDYGQIKWAANQRHQQQFEALTQQGYRLIEQPAGFEYWLTLDSSFDDYIKGLSKNARRDYNKKMGAAEALNPRLEPFTGDQAIESFFEQYIPLHIAYWQAKNGYSYLIDPDEQRFAIEWAKVLQQEGRLQLMGLYLEDQLACLNLNYVVGNTLNLVLTMQTGTHQQYFPGLINLFLTIQSAIDNGYRYCNMGTGDYAYKKQFSTHQEPIIQTTFANPRSLVGKLLVDRIEKLWATAPTGE